MTRVTDIDALRALYGTVRERSRRKQLDRLDPHAKHIISLAPFVVIATAGRDGLGDATPRGDAPGFVTVEDDRTLLLPDRPGNNRLDTLQNLIERPGIGLLFLIPGMDETLRVNGTAEILADPALNARFTVDGKLPKTVLRITVREVYIHCAKALMRSRLWDPAAQIDRSIFPSMGEMMRDQIGVVEGVKTETQSEMVERYKQTLY
jgi:PPOX class probable FMN-dependent enzyme